MELGRAVRAFPGRQEGFPIQVRILVINRQCLTFLEYWQASF